MKSDFLIALTQLAAERGLPRDMVLSAIEAALASAYKKDNATAGQNIAVRLNPGTGDVRVFVLMDVVKKAADVEDSLTQMTLAAAKKIKKDASVDETVELESTQYLAGRIAAQTAKQVVMQRLREAERDLIFEEYAGRADDVVTGTIQRMEPRQIIVDLGRAEGALPEREQVPTERYRPNQKMKFYIAEVSKSGKGPEIILSRSNKDLLRRLFEIEVPEIYNGMVEIKAIVREAGSRSKVAVWAKQEGVDAVGSCVGLRGIRIQNIVNELQGEKIDVVQWHRDPAVFISNALNPSQTIHVGLDDEGNATVVVQEKQLSLAIGREGQNARLAAKLTGWKIDILSSAEADMERLKRTAPVRTEKETIQEEPVTEPAVVDEPVAAEAQIETEPAEPPVAAEAEPLAEAVEVTETEAAPAEVEEAPEPVLATVEAEESVTDVSWQEGETTTETEDEEVVEEDEEEGIPITDDVWQVPQLVPSGDSQIMFAEDLVIPGRGGEGRRRGGRGRGSMEETGKAKRAAKKRKGASTGVQT